MVWNESGTTVSKALLSAISNGSRPYSRHYSGVEQTPLCQKLQLGIKENELYRTSRTVRLSTVYSFLVKYRTGLMSKGTEERMYSHLRLKHCAPYGLCDIAPLSRAQLMEGIEK